MPLACVDQPRSYLLSCCRPLPAGFILKDPDALAVVFVREQKMLVSVRGRTYRCDVSTAKAGTGCEEGSFKTPVGWHKVVSRHGAKAPLGQVFVSRRALAGVVKEEKRWREKSGDGILTRIFRLEGLEMGMNKDPSGKKDTYSRCIYIHGTNQEHLLGTAASHGCVRMANRDVADLFSLVGRKRRFFVFIADCRPQAAAHCTANASKIPPPRSP